jgi:hypothetical protein
MTRYDKLLYHITTNNSEIPTSTNEDKETTPKDDLSTKREFHYGMKKYSFPSKFKKFQPPFLKKPTKDKNLEEITEHNQSEIDQLILSLLRKKHNSTNHLLHPDTAQQDKDKDYTSLTQPDYNKNKMEDEKDKDTIPDRKFVQIKTNTKLNLKIDDNKTTNTDRTDKNKTDEDVIIIDDTKMTNTTEDKNSKEENWNNKTLQTTPNTRHQPPLKNNTPHIDLDTPHRHTEVPHTRSIITPNNKPSIFNPQKKTQKNTPQTNPIQQNVHSNIDIDTNNKQKDKNNHLQNFKNKKIIKTNDTNHSNIQTKIQTSDDPGISIPNLTPELKSLSKVILSQHNALSQHIIELGNICLNFTNILDKKKNSSNKLIEEEIIPRSQCIKCKLTTSPGYENNPNFIILK